MPSTSALGAHYDKDYWTGTGAHGYKGEGYRDFAVNGFKAAYIAQHPALANKVGRVLDVGCAYGFLVQRLREDWHIHAWGVDVSQYALDQAPPELRAHLHEKSVHDLGEYPDNFFDLIVSFGVLEHLPEELILLAMREMKRVAPRGILSITMKGDYGANNDPSHASLRTFREWQQIIPEGYELWSDTEEWWTASHLQNTCVVAPTIYDLGREGYGGVERLVSLFLRGMIPSYQTVGCVCTDDSVLPAWVRRHNTGMASQDYQEPGLKQFPRLWGPPDGYNCFLDFSHSKTLGRSHPHVPHISPIWHDPVIMQPPEPKSNVVCLSEWQAKRFRDVYKQDCIVLDPICGDGDYFASEQRKTFMEWDDYILFIGKLHPTKGALEAISVCRALNQKLVIVGPVTPGDPQEYVDAVLAKCDNTDVVYMGEVSEAVKRLCLQGAKALLYPVSYPTGQGESHSHKMIEAMLCGTPCIAYDQGAMSEVIDEGVTGFVVPSYPGVTTPVEDAIRKCETLDRTACRARAMERWDYRGTVQRWMKIIEEVRRGARW